MNLKKEKKKENNVASTIKTLAVSFGIIGIGAGFLFKDYTIILIAVSFISTIFIYSIGEALSLLQKIVDNTAKEQK